MKKRIMSFVLTAAMLTLLIPAGAFTVLGDEKGDVATFCGENGGNLQWSVDDDVLYITGKGGMADYYEDNNGGQAVSPWIDFSYTEIKKVVVGEGVTSIGSFAFYGLENLTDASLPDTLLSVGTSAFANTALTKLIIPDKVVSIGDSSFYNCVSLESLTLPEGLKTIGDYAFSYCSKLDSVSVPDSVTQMGIDAFFYCISLGNVTIGSGLYKIGDEAFSSCASLETVTLKEGLTSIGRYAFESCGALEEIIFPDSVCTIDFAAVSGCKGLKKLSLGSNVKKIASDAASGCTALETIELSEQNENFRIVDGALYNYDCTELVFYPEAGPATEFTAAPATKMIDSYAFAGCEKISKVTLPDTLKHIGEYAFSDCTQLKEITVPDGVTEIGQSTFENCTALETVNFGTGLKVINDSAFESCTALSAVLVPEGVTEIGSAAFAYCTALNEITLPESLEKTGEYAFASTNYSASDENKTDGSLYINNWLVEVSPDAVTFEVKDGTIGIADGAFSKCSLLSSIKLPDSVKYSTGLGLSSDSSVLCDISVDDGSEFFASDGGVLYSADKSLLVYYPRSKNETFFAVPDSVTGIGESAFCNCVSLNSVDLASHVTKIGDEAFSGCLSLIEITGCDSIISLGSDCFKETPFEENLIIENPDGCYIGKCLYLSACNKNKFEIKSDTASVAPKAFLASSVKNLNIPGSVKTIEKNTFLYCGNISCIVMGNGVETIEKNAFSNCAGLVSVAIPASVTNIAAGAFNCCGIDLVIYGEKDSCAQQYAAENKITFVSTDTAVKGEVDENAGISASDALSALQFSVEKTIPNYMQLLCADIDCDGAVSASDALSILQYSVNKIDSLN